MSANTLKRMPHVAAVVLAAGRSARMGTHKLLLPLDGEPIVRRTVRQVCEAGFDEVLVIVGYEYQNVLDALDGLPIHHVVNADYATGMGSSFRTAVGYLTNVAESRNQDPERKRRQRAGTALSQRVGVGPHAPEEGPREKVRNDAAMFALADQPFVTARDYRALLDTYRSHVAERPAIVSARYGDVTAPPHLFARALFPELAVLEHGARPLLERHAGEMLVLQLPRELLEDIDTPEDYERAKSLLKNR
jgi:molybdenum cofactor cytidylyltransferase